MKRSTATLERTPQGLQILLAGRTQADLLPELAQALIGALMQGVHDAANLSVATARALLAPTDGTTRTELQRLAEAWQFSWRTYEVCATTASNVTQITATHQGRGFERLLNIFEREIDGKRCFDQTTIHELRAAFERLRIAQSHALDSAIETHRRLILLAKEAFDGRSAH